MPITVLVVDDEADIRTLVSDILKDAGYHVKEASNGVQAIEYLHQFQPTIVLLDVWLQGSEVDGLGVLELAKEKYPQLPIILMSGHGTIETAVNAIKHMGAFDYVAKPFTEERVTRAVQLAKEFYMLQRENIELKKRVISKPVIIGNSPSTVQLRNAIERIAPTASRVLLMGPSGSGKELVGEIIHQKSKRNAEAFVIFNPVNASSDKAIIDLFGQTTTAPNQQRIIGALEKAHLGTLFIDEITAMSMEMQHMLLRFLQDQVIARPGQNRINRLDVRVISSTSRDIESLVKQGKFLQDLYYRLNVVPLPISPLLSRREDIPLLCEYYMKVISEQSGLQPRTIAIDAMAVLQAYDWPGNVRQLKNVLEWLLIMTPDHVKEIHISSLPPYISSQTVDLMHSETSNNNDVMSMPLREAREVFERQYLLAQMQRFNNNISKTSNFVGMERSALHRKLKSLNVNTDNNSDNGAIDTNEGSSEAAANKELVSAYSE